MFEIHCCPGCGGMPTVSGFWHAVCADCFDPVDDCSDLEKLRGSSPDGESAALAAWDAAVTRYLDENLTDENLRTEAWAAAERYEKTGHQKHLRLERMLRGELTRRHEETNAH